MSKGVLSDSMMTPMKKRTNPMNWGTANHMFFWASTILTRSKLPAMMATAAPQMTRGISAEMYM